MPVEVLGIDFGTSNTVAVLSGPGRAPRVISIDGNSWMPSAVFVDDDGSLTVGRDAERKARVAPERFEPNPKRRIDDGDILLGVRVVPVVDAIAAVLRRVGEETRRQLNGRNPDQVNLTHPAQWGSARRNVLLTAARAAGIGASIGLLPEPVAAAAHFASLPGRSLPVGSSLAVYDLGGGTFDCAVVGSTASGYTVLAESGLPDVGGVDFDQTILDHLGRTAAAVDPGRWQSLTRPRTAGDRRAARSLRGDVRAAKETLSRYSQTDLPLPEPFEDSLLTRREFDGLIRPAIIRTVETLAATVERAGAPQHLAGVYLVGGSSRIPLVATVISEKLGLIATTMDQPETAVAMGAAISAGSRLVPERTQSMGPRPPAGSRPTLGTGPAAAVRGPSVSSPRGPSVSGPAGPSVTGPRGSGLSGPPVGRRSVSGPSGPSVTGPRGASVSGPSVSGPSVSGPAVGGTRGPSVSGPHGPSVTGPRGVAEPARSVPGAGSAGRRPRGRGRMVIVGVIAALVVAAVTVVIIVTTKGSHEADPGGSTTASASSTSSGRSRSSATTAGGPVIPATCENSPVDSSGMTPCLLALAGPNADRAMGCTPVKPDDSNLQGVFGSAKVVAGSGCAGLDGGGIDVVYIQLDSADAVPPAMQMLATNMSSDERDWQSGPGAGSYVAAVGDKGPEIYWSYRSLPVIAYATTSAQLTGGKGAPTAQELGDFWKQGLLPQPAG